MPWLSFFSFFFCSKKTLFLSLSSFLHFDFVCYAMVHSSDSATSYPHLGVMQLYIKGARPELMIMNYFIFAVYFCWFASVTAEGEKSQGLTGIWGRTLSAPVPPPWVNPGVQCTTYLDLHQTCPGFFETFDWYIWVYNVLNICPLALSCTLIYSWEALSINFGLQAQSPHGPDHLVYSQPEEKLFLYINVSVISINLHQRSYFHASLQWLNCLLSVGG